MRRNGRDAMNPCGLDIAAFVAVKSDVVIDADVAAFRTIALITVNCDLSTDERHTGQ